ncbi:hypothetical protein AVEN_59271-1 [Araneus ventricosus]|uniref:Uncharacterized protein n=1 Tax=Araneus ventricosus TaxID=182803 RepID=A0A4Y2G5B7_ARAVE|nr:hypothetical protein AVEN_59271-1 [Araneus ventricosus]
MEPSQIFNSFKTEVGEEEFVTLQTLLFTKIFQQVPLLKEGKILKLLLKHPIHKELRIGQQPPLLQHSFMISAVKKCDEKFEIINDIRKVRKGRSTSGLHKETLREGITIFQGITSKVRKTKFC